jgi:hypothetical protein
MSGDARQRIAAALADRLIEDEAPVAPYATPVISQFIESRIGCRVFNPFAYGLDLAAVCMKGTRPVTARLARLTAVRSVTDG